MTFLKLVGKKDAQKGSFKTEIQAKQWSATLRWEMLFWHRFQLIMTLGLRATNPEKSFAEGTGWANWPLVLCGSSCCEERKSGARSGVGRPRQDRLVPHAVTTSVHLTNTSLDNLPTRDSAKPHGLRGKCQGTAEQFLLKSFSPSVHVCSCISANVTHRSATGLIIFTRLSSGFQGYLDTCLQVLDCSCKLTKQCWKLKNNNRCTKNHQHNKYEKNLDRIGKTSFYYNY